MLFPDSRIASYGSAYIYMNPAVTGPKPLFQALIHANADPSHNSISRCISGDMSIHYSTPGATRNTPPQSTQAIDDAVQTLTGAIQSALKASTPLKQPAKHTKRWWTPELTKLCRQQKNLRNRWKRTRREEDHKVWRDKDNEYTHAISKAKESTWRNFVQTASSKTIWQLKKCLTAGTTQNTIPTLEGHAETFEQLSELLQKNFFPKPPQANLQDIC